MRDSMLRVVFADLPPLFFFSSVPCRPDTGVYKRST